jgi:hypothetical protein
MHAWLRRFAWVALFVAGCAPFKAGSGADASADDAGEPIGDMQVRADMNVDATRPDATLAFDASGDATADASPVDPRDATVTTTDASTAPSDAAADMARPLTTQCVPALPVTNVIAETSVTPHCCKIRLGVDAAASSYIYSRAEAPFPSSVDPASDASEYVRLVLHGRNRCYGLSMVTDSDFATTVHYEVPPEARMAAATFTDDTTEPMTMECVPGTAPRASSDGVGFPAVVSGTCPIREPDCPTALVRWVSTTTPICSAPPCFAAGSTWLVVGWLESSALRACLGNSSPDFGLDEEDACPLEGAPIEAINDVPDCP